MNSILPYFPNPDFAERYISPKKLFNYLQTKYSDCISEIGKSFLGKPIYMMSLGSGSTKVVAWSQMHGNESTGTLAMLDLLEIRNREDGLFKNLLSEITLDFIFMLNPDGSEKWTRRNALDIDLNRDFLKKSSKEFQLLRDIVETGKYHYALNLHDQRTIFTTNGKDPATLSFLAPSVNFEREVTQVRKQAMAVISQVFNQLDSHLPDQIARYSDEFYPTSTGDNFTKMGLPTILFEGGHYRDDYKRLQTRKFYTLALYESLCAIMNLKGDIQGWESYSKIPVNKETHCDVIYRNVTLNLDYECTLDIAVQFREEYIPGNTEISFLPIVIEVGDVGAKKGWKEIDCTGKKFISTRKFPKLDEPVDFTFG